MTKLLNYVKKFTITTGHLFYHDPSHPHISMHILHTVVKENSLNSQGEFVK